MPGAADSNDPARGALRRAPISGEVEPRRRSISRRDDEDDDGPSDEDLERFGGVTRTCRSCGKEIYDDAEVCYICGGPAGGVEATPSKWWAIVIVALLILAFSGWAMVRWL